MGRYWRRMSWDMGLSARSKLFCNSRKQKSEGPRAGSVCRAHGLARQSPLWGERKQAGGWPGCTRTSKGSAGGLLSSKQAYEESLRGLGAADGAVIKVKGCHVDPAPSHCCVCKSVRDGAKGPTAVPVCWGISLVPGATLGTSGKKQDLSIWWGGLEPQLRQV